MTAPETDQVKRLHDTLRPETVESLLWIADRRTFEDAGRGTVFLYPDEARAIAALLPPPPDPDVEAVREMLAVYYEEQEQSGIAARYRDGTFTLENDGAFRIALTVYKAGKAAEREERT